MKNGLYAHSFYEAERKNITVTHDDFAKDNDFDSVVDYEEIYNFIKSKSDIYDKHFKSVRVKKTDKENSIIGNSIIIDKLFDDISTHFKDLNKAYVLISIHQYYGVNFKLLFSSLKSVSRNMVKEDILSITDFKEKLKL